MQEAVAAVAIAIAVLVAATHVLGTLARQHRLLDGRTQAVLEAGNIMEQAMARPWADVTGEKLATLRLSDACRELLPDARLQLQVTPEGTSDDARRISVQIDWQRATGQHSRPVRLVAWRFRGEGTEP